MEYSPAIAQRLQEVLGQRLVAFSVGLRSPKTIGRFARGEEQPDEETAGKLARLLEEVVEPVLRVDSAEVLRAWIVGANPGLDDRATARRAAIDFVHNG
jgi:hypothetical protein